MPNGAYINMCKLLLSPLPSMMQYVDLSLTPEGRYIDQNGPYNSIAQYIYLPTCHTPIKVHTP